MGPLSGQLTQEIIGVLRGQRAFEIDSQGHSFAGAIGSWSSTRKQAVFLLSGLIHISVNQMNRVELNIP